MRKITHNEVFERCNTLADFFIEEAGSANVLLQSITCYPVPRGGVPVAYALGEAFLAKGVTLQIENDLKNCDFVLDDLIDSGATRKKFKDEDPELPFHALFSKEPDQGDLDPNEWVVFPWEDSAETDGGEDIPTRLLQYIGEDVKRGGLKETPARFLQAWKFWTSGYSKDPTKILKVFKDGAEKYDEMVLVKNIPFYSQCEHHMAPFFGVAHIAYIPDGQIVGLSKFSRLVDMFARRLQVQERLTSEVAQSIQKVLKPKGVAVVLNARHMCMESRGVCQQGHSTTTSAMLGAFKDEHDTRMEFLELIK